MRSRSPSATNADHAPSEARPPTVRPDTAPGDVAGTPTAWIVNAFTDGAVGGNPAGVVLDADRLTPRQRGEIARRVGLSETAFVSASTVATVRLEFFTPTRQIAHCGHATIAAFALLRSLDRVRDGRLSKETIDGLRTVVVEGEVVSMEQAAPHYQPLPGDSELAGRIAASIGARPLASRIVDTGNRFAVIELPDRETLRNLQPHLPSITEVSEACGLIGYYVYSRQGAPSGRIATARMFAPLYGIAEESATGMAAGPLACVLHDEYGAAPAMAIEQGALMSDPSPSALHVRLEVERGQITRLFVGGRAHVVGQVPIDLGQTP